MTFAEYNTDANFDNDKSSLDELVKIGLSEGKTSDEIKNSLSPKWQKSKKIGEFDSYVSKYSTPKIEEQKPTEEKVAEKVIEEAETPKEELPNSNIKQKDKNFLDKTNAIANEAEKQELENVESRREYNQKALYDEMTNAQKSFKNIDDHMVEQLPTFMFRRYMNGEFGDPKGTDAKLRLAHFMLNGVQTALRRFSNGAALAAGKTPLYANEMSDYEQYQLKNLTEGMENRWNKYKQDTQNAIDLASKESMNEQEARLTVEQITRNKRLDTAWNMMNEKQKVYEMEVIKEIGDNIGNMDLNEVADFLTGAAVKGNLTKEEAAAVAIAQLAKKTPDILKNLPEGKTKDIVIQMLGGGDIQTIVAGLGGAGTGDDDKKDNNDNNGLNIGITMNDEEYSRLTDKADSLSSDFYNGKISKDEFVKEYDKLVKEMNKHKIYKWKNNKSILSTKDILNANKELELKDKFGEDTKSKVYKNGKKALEYFDGKTQLAEYFKSTDEPNFIDAKAAIKNKDYKMKDYQEALKQYEILKSAKATNMIGKY